MKLHEVKIINPANLKTFFAKIRIDLGGYQQIIDVAVQATNLQLATKLIKQLYGPTSLVNIPKQQGTSYK